MFFYGANYLHGRYSLTQVMNTTNIRLVFAAVLETILQNNSRQTRTQWGASCSRSARPVVRQDNRLWAHGI